MTQKNQAEIRACVPDGVFKTACELCPWGCGMEVLIKNGHLEKVLGNREHPLNEGVLCSKGLALKDFIYSKNRITHPMKKENGDWRRISWDEALDICAEKLQHIKANYGPKSLAVAIGMPVLLGGNTTVSFLRRFCDIYGTPNCFSVESLCYRCRIVANILTLGKFPAADIANAKTIMVWGNNPHDSNPPAAKKINKAIKRGARLIVIDPRKTPTAKKADIHLQIRPGTDGALALGMINFIITEEIYDRDFVTNWTVGFEELAKAVAAFDPERVEKTTWIPAQDIRKTARLFATHGPSCMVQGTNSLDQHVNGFQNSRALAILFAITGNIDKMGGMITTSGIHVNPLRLPERMEGQPLGVDRFPLFYEIWGRTFGEGQAMELADTILTQTPYPIGGLIISGSNPVLTWPNSDKIKKAIESLEFTAIMDMRMTSTAQLCDLFLPAATFLERTELCDYYGTLNATPFIALRQKIMQAGEAKSDVEFWLELGKRMGYGDFFPWESVEEVLAYALSSTDLTIGKLKQHPGGLCYGEKRIDAYKKKGFRTPSGKVELFSKTLEDLGHDPLPGHRESPESPVTNLDMAKKYPLILTTGARTGEFLHSEYRDIPRLRKKRPEATAEIHPST
ncbi:MAG: molybdopterin-dependent oxidoreductase, partial [Desulfobacterales bacterium]|nr:molybdopterin-dependent oxidoreductase [Desulfobacterales bacterium]